MRNLNKSKDNRSYFRSYKDLKAANYQTFIEKSDIKNNDLYKKDNMKQKEREIDKKLFRSLCLSGISKECKDNSDSQRIKSFLRTAAKNKLNQSKQSSQQP